MSDIDEPLPNKPSFYTSPHPIEVQAAIGRLITLWAGTEGALVMQVARLVASDIEVGSHVTAANKLFHHFAYLKAVAVGMGTTAKATTAQLQNLALDREAELKSACDKIIDIKAKRDAIATSGAREGGKTHFHGFGASRSRMGTDKVYSLEDIDRWCAELQAANLAIDEIVTDITGWSWKHIEAGEKRWRRAQRQMGERIREIPLGPSNVLPTISEGDKTPQG